jgi:hypothetical protein
LPLVPRGTEWPRCGACEGPLQFLAQLRLSDAGLAPDGLVLLFLCNNDPGSCADWEPDSGGNRALVVPLEGLSLAASPEGETILPEVDGVSFREFDSGSADEDDFDAYERVREEHDDVLGQIGGKPAWLQGDEPQSCDCGKPMSFVAQLEESGGGGINLGDAGVGYAFACTGCRRAKFLWQCC